MAKSRAATRPKGGAKRVAEGYTHPDKTVLMRPEVGTQAQFRKKKPPVTYKYDSSLSPSLEWDANNPAREQGEALIRKILDAGDLDAAKSAARELKALSKPFLNWTGKAEREVVKSHINYVVADTAKWEQQAAYILDTHPAVDAFVKNAGLGFAIPYIHNGQPHDYVPDFIVRVPGEPVRHLIIETKGFDDLADVKTAAAERWTSAVNADGRFGIWHYAIARKVDDVRRAVDAMVLAGRSV
jgi:hypothetical protein